jgi:ubiquinone/menaquinone biosynthesis C-methylase UbiE
VNHPIQLEEERLKDISGIEDYNMAHERHRIFPEILKTQNPKRILDVASGIGVVASRIKDSFSGELVCNDISPTCLYSLQKMGMQTMSFNLDDVENSFPIPDKNFDAVIALATIEHLIHVDHFVQEIHRILTENGCLYLSAPNYNGLLYLLPLWLSGKTFHDPLRADSRYEFYAHLRYFTYRTLLDYISSFGFTPLTVYLPLPEMGTRYLKLQSKSKISAWVFRNGLKAIYKIFSPRWASEPVICFKKGNIINNEKPKIVIL